MTKHLIRQAILADLNFVLTCSQLLADEEHAMNPKVHNEKDNPHEAYLQSVLAGEQSDAFVLRCDHCGCLVVNVNHSKKIIYLSELYVLPQFRSQGIASKLIDYVKAYRDKNYPDYSIRLNCLRENNVAQACYEHNGFKTFRKDRWGVLYEYPVENEMKNFANMVDPNIQIATLNDSDFILNCSHLLQADGRKQDPRLPDIPVDCYDDSFLNIMAGNDPNAIIFRYSYCGFMCVLIKDSQKALHVLSLYVLPEYRGQNIGTKLISYLKDFRDKYYSDYVISLKCLSRNKAAQSFYEGNDFTATYKDSWRRIYEYPINQNLKNFSNITRKYYSHREV